MQLGELRLQCLAGLQAAPDLRSVAIFDEMIRRHPELGAGIRRTLERRIRSWRAIRGEEREVIFRQVHEPGHMGLSDFTDSRHRGLRISIEISVRPIAS
ncbi:hypothetical protein Xaut_5004 (plasmid) [Xanthobacter versatilis]|uniref:Uncharacterized protein n=1 Tax=Xanthobacter autotrophicus (strain ATCC BAA-1158 / Py2) TaxID=78245 RepID=A7IQA7_XANP2|nr:hypothetical protein Xaut_5004 [Xanthobacter autotrophicus Py2]